MNSLEGEWFEARVCVVIIITITGILEARCPACHLSSKPQLFCWGVCFLLLFVLQQVVLLAVWNLLVVTYDSLNETILFFLIVC